MNTLFEPEENYKTGWIKIFRSIRNHWIYPKNTPLTKFEAWITILIEVNHSGEKLQLGYDILECNRGEKLYSLDTWAKLFNWDKSKVRRFFDLLQKDSMIVLKSEQKTTRLIVCNYDTYQSERNASETQVKRKRNASETQVTPIKEYKNENNDKEVKVKTWRDDYQIYLKECKEAFIKFDSDKLMIEKQERLNPNVDIKLTIEKAYDKFWKTEAGWKNKKKAKTENIDWEATIKNAISNKSNIVYKQKSF